MAWTKQTAVIHTARTTDNDLSIRFFVAADATPVPMVELVVQSEAADGSVITEAHAAPLSASGLTGPERTTLIALLKKVRDNALPALGYTGP